MYIYLATVFIFYFFKGEKGYLYFDSQNLKQDQSLNITLQLFALHQRNEFES